MNLDTIIRLFERFISAFDRPWEVLIELLLIGISVNWCAGVLHGTRGTRLLRGVLILLVAVTLVVRVLAAQLGWTRLELLYRYFVFGLAFIALVAFQPELRRALIRAGDVSWLRKNRPRDRLIGALVEASGHLSRNRHGAVVALQRDVGLANWAEQGTALHAELSATLLNSIFYPNSPLHDLGVIVRNDTVLAAGCQFPMAESGDVDPGLGSRHRAAVGMSQESDALVLVVSEETGVVSLADRGHLVRHLSPSDLERELRNRLSNDALAPQTARRFGLTDVKRLVRRLALVVPLTLVVWFLADQATMTTRDSVPIELNIVHDGSIAVEFESPRTPTLLVSITGATRDVEAVRASTSKDALKIDWDVRAPYSKAGTYTLSGDELLSFLNGLSGIHGRGVVVSSVSPDVARFVVDDVVVVKMPVQAEVTQRRIAESRFEPAEVQVSMRKRDLESVAEPQRLVRAQLDDRLSRSGSDQTITLDNVPLDSRVGVYRALRVEPATVSASVRVVGETTRKHLTGVAVQVQASVAFLQEYDVQIADQGEWLIDIDIEGDRSIVDRLRSQDVFAWLPLASELPTENFRTAEVVMVLPPGVQLVGRPRQIQYRLVKREAVTP